MVRLFALRDCVNKPAVVTPWSMIHFSSGIAAHSVALLVVQKYSDVSMLTCFAAWAGLHLLYEIKDVYYAYEAEKSKRTDINSFANSMGDQFFAMIGFISALVVLKEKNTITATLMMLVLSFAILRSPAFDTGARTGNDIWNERG